MADTSNGTQAAKATGEISKKEAVRRALKSLGQDAKPLQIREHVKKRYNLEMGLDHISNAKSEILREMREAQPAVQKPTSTPSVAAKPTAPQAESPKLHFPKQASGKAAMSPGAGSQGISLKDIETVKNLVERVGATPLKQLIDVMAR